MFRTTVFRLLPIFLILALVWVGCTRGTPEVTETEESAAETSGESSEPAGDPAPAEQPKPPVKVKTATKTNAPIEVLETKSYPLDKLPAMQEDGEVPRLDGGRLTAQTPTGWTLGNKQPNMVCRFYKTSTTGVPRIVIRAEAATGITNVTAENVAQYASQVAGSLGTAKVEENLRPLILGENAWVRYVKRAMWPRGGSGSQDKVEVEWQVLQTVRNGRTYYVDLQVLSGELAKSPADRDAAYSVAANIKFTEPAPAKSE